MDRIGRDFKATRKKLKLTQSQFSKLLGIAQGYLSEVENGIKVPSDTLLFLLDHITKVKEEESYKIKYMVLAEEHMDTLNELILLKEKFLTLKTNFKLPKKNQR